MRTLRILFRVLLLTSVSSEITRTSGTGQTKSTKEARALAPGLRKLTGDDAKRAEELDKAIEAAIKSDRWDQAIARAEQLLALRVKAQGPNHFQTANADWRLKVLRKVAATPRDDRVSYQSARRMSEQAEVLRSHGEHGQALPLFQKALETRRRLLGDDHPETATSFADVAFALESQGKYAQAQQMFEKALEICLRVFTDDHLDTATCYNGLAYNLDAQGSHAQARPQYEKALAIRRRLLTDKHPHTIQSYRNLAGNLYANIETARNADRWDEAIVLAKELVALRTRVEGPKHFQTVNDKWLLRALRRVAAMPKGDRAGWQSANTVSEHARSLQALAKYAPAQALFEENLGLLRRLFSDDHPHTANGMEMLARNLAAQEKYAQAQPLFEKALDVRRRLLTDDHPDTANSSHSLAHNLSAQQKHAQAQRHFDDALEIQRRLLTDDHTDTARAYNCAANNLSAQGKYAQAQPLFEKALEIRRRRLTDDHPDTALSYTSLAENLDGWGKYAAAQPLHEKAMEVYRRRFTDNHADSARSYGSLAYNLWLQGKYTQAQPLFEKALDTCRRLFTDNHPHTAAGYNNLAANLNCQGKYAQAQPLFQKALEIRRRLLTDDHPDTAASYHSLAVNLNSQGNYVTAQPLFEKALEINRRLLTDDDPRTAQTYNELAHNFNDQRMYAQAQPLVEKALEIRRRLLTDDHPNTARSYDNVALNLFSQGKYTLAQSLFETALEIRLRLFADNHPDTAESYVSVANNLSVQGKYTEAGALYEKALEINRRLLTDDHPIIAAGSNHLAINLNAQGKYVEARDRWLNAAKSLETVRLRDAFTGMERAGLTRPMREPLAAVLARLGHRSEAWRSIEEDLGRGLLDELFARRDQRLTPAERGRLQELITALERLDRLVDATPKDLGKAERAKRFEDLKQKRELGSIALGEFQTKLAQTYGPVAGKAATLTEIQAALPVDAALVAWIDILPAGPNAADPDGEHWGVVVRSRGTPAWVAIAGTGKDGLWTAEDTALAGRVRAELRQRPRAGVSEVQPLVEKLRSQRLDPLATALGPMADGLPPAQRLIVLPSRAMAGIPVEALLAPDDTRTVSYAPSGTVFKYLREQPRPDRHAGLLALGDPVYERGDKSSEPPPLPDHGLLVNVVAPGSNAATHGLKPGDVLLAYNGTTLKKNDDLKVMVVGEKPIAIEVWRDGKTSARDLAPGKLGLVLDSRPAPEAITANRAIAKVLVAARGGDEDLAPLPGTRYEVEAIAKLFRTDDRPARTLLGTDASEPELDRLSTSGDLAHFGFIHLATHGVIDEGSPQRSAVILTQTGLPDPLEQVLNHKPAFDGRLQVREIQRGWELKAELVTLSACETALGREAGGEGFVGFTQALLMSGARSVCLSLWKVDDTATALLMHRFYANLLGRRPGLSSPMPKAEALREAKVWLRTLRRDEIRVFRRICGFSVGDRPWLETVLVQREWDKLLCSSR